MSTMRSSSGPVKNSAKKANRYAANALLENLMGSYSHWTLEYIKGSRLEEYLLIVKSPDT